MQRYSLIDGNFPREFLLLQGMGCRWKKCKYCDYYTDVSDDPFSVNKSAIDRVTGQTGVLDVINSGSAFEIDNKTVELLKQTVKDKNIHTIWFESHWLYRNELKAFGEQFGNNVTVKWRTGVETFNGNMRSRLYKGIPQNVEPLDIRKYFEGICLLVGFVPQSFDDIIKDLKIAEEYFEYYSVNVFNENSTDTKRDEILINNFKEKIYPELIKSKKVEVLIENTDLGVG